MLDRLVETFCAVDDFCQAFMPQWEAYLLNSYSTLTIWPKPSSAISKLFPPSISQKPCSAQCFPPSPGRLNRLSTQSHQTRPLLLASPLAASIKTRYQG
jgi:hypothetical protein